VRTVRGAQPGGHPAAQGSLKGPDAEAAEEGAEARPGGGVAAAEGRREGEGEALATAELGDGGAGLAAAEDGEDGQAEDGGQGVAGALGAARVRDPASSSNKVNRAGVRHGSCGGRPAWLTLPFSWQAQTVRDFPASAYSPPGHLTKPLVVSGGSRNPFSCFT